jgi:AraC-like DNA-binding protein/mannose-6-phosphate isomerase-like protein (cupin superfamily)
MQVYLESENQGFGNSSVYMELQTYQGLAVTARPHIHSALEIILMVQGRIEAAIGNEQYTAEPGDLLLVRSNTIHHFTSRDEGTVSYWVLKIKPTLITELAPPAHCGEYLMFFALDRKPLQKFWKREALTGTPLAMAASALAAEVQQVHHGAEMGLRLCAAQLLLAILRQAHESGGYEQIVPEEAVARRIYDTVVFINRNYNQNITAEDCSKIACMSYSYFSRSFRRVTGKNFRDYLNQVRVAHGEKALLTTDQSVTEVAALCGYDNVSYFISVYRRIKGETPHTTAKRRVAFVNPS